MDVNKPHQPQGWETEEINSLYQIRSGGISSLRVRLLGAPSKEVCSCQERRLPSTKLLQHAVEKPLKNDMRKSVAGRFPLPNCDADHPPRLDDSVTCLIPKSAKTYNRLLSKLQQFSADALRSLAFIQHQLDKKEPIDQPTLKAAVKTRVTVLGNPQREESTL